MDEVVVTITEITSTSDTTESSIDTTSFIDNEPEDDAGTIDGPLFSIVLATLASIMIVQRIRGRKSKFQMKSRLL